MCVDAEEVRNVRRIIALEEAVVASGIDRIKVHWAGREDMYTAQLRQLAREALEGVEVFWNNPQGAQDGNLDSVSYFGKMYVVPYPFHCVVVYDDAHDEAIVRDEYDETSPLTSHTKLAMLLSTNFTPEIMAKRKLRQKLGVLSERKHPSSFPLYAKRKFLLVPSSEDSSGEPFQFIPSRDTTNLSASTGKTTFVFGLAAIRNG